MAELTRAVADHGYTQPTPVQMEAIAVILDGRDAITGLAVLTVTIQTQTALQWFTRMMRIIRW